MNMDWMNEQGGQTSKTPTCLLLKPDLSFDSFGYEAVEKYSSLQSDGEEKEYLFFKHFKMALHTDEVRYYVPIAFDNILNEQCEIMYLFIKFLHAVRSLAKKATPFRSN